MSVKKNEIAVSGYGTMLNSAIQKLSEYRSSYSSHSESTISEDLAVLITLATILAKNSVDFAKQYQGAVFELERSKGILRLKSRLESAKAQTEVLIRQRQEELTWWLGIATKRGLGL